MIPVCLRGDRSCLSEIKDHIGDVDKHIHCTGGSKGDTFRFAHLGKLEYREQSASGDTFSLCAVCFCFF